MQLIIVDDCSTNDIQDRLKEYAKSDDRIEIYKSDRNIGQYKSINEAFSVAKGDWIATLDHDDWYAPQRLQRLLDVAERMNVDLIADNQVFFDRHANAASRFLFPVDQDSIEFDIDTYLKRSDPVKHVSSDYGLLKPIFRKSYGQKYGIYFGQSRILGVDYYSMLYHIILGAKFVMIPDPLYVYVEPFGGISRKYSTDDRKPYDFRDLVQSTSSFKKDHSSLLNETNKCLISLRMQRFTEIDRYNQFRSAASSGHFMKALRSLCSDPIGILRVLFYNRFDRLWRMAHRPKLKDFHLPTSDAFSPKIEEDY